MKPRSRFSVLTRHSLLVCLTLAGCLACGHPVQRTLEGRWMGEGVENFDDGEVAAATGWARGASMEFSGSEITIAIPAEDPRTAEYKVVSVHQNNVKLNVQAPGGAQPLALILDDEQSMRWRLDDSRTIVMRRQ